MRAKLFGALRAYGDLVRVRSPRIRMITITAPGADAGLDWDEGICSHRGPHRHSGPDGCRVSAAPAAAWNERAPGWWRQLHHDAKQAADRSGRGRLNLLVRAVEQQRRGLLHWHVVVGYSTPSERAAADAYVRELSERSPAAGFGFVDRKRDVKEPTAAAAYLASYFVTGKGGRGKIALTESVRSDALPPSIFYVKPQLSQRSGLTMRTLRMRRYLWVRFGEISRLVLEQGWSIEAAYAALELRLIPTIDLLILGHDPP